MEGKDAWQLDSEKTESLEHPVEMRYIDTGRRMNCLGKKQKDTDTLKVFGGWGEEAT